MNIFYKLLPIFFSMTLMLPLGVHLAVRLGYIAAPDWVVPATWGIALAWLAPAPSIASRGRRPRVPWCAAIPSTGYQVGGASGRERE